MSKKLNFSFAQFLLGSTHVSNGHFQTEIGAGMTLDDCLAICKDLEDLEPAYSFVCEVWIDGGISIYQKDFWKEGEHPMGHRDRLILGVGGE